MDSMWESERARERERERENKQDNLHISERSLNKKVTQKKYNMINGSIQLNFKIATFDFLFSCLCNLLQEYS